jgi:hypothetical protein
MTQEKIINMAEQAGFDPHDMSSDFTCNLQNINAFAKLVAEKAIKEALAQLKEQEPVAWRYKPARENNPRWEYTTKHPLDMGDGYLRPSLVEYCKCIEPLYAREKPKLMLEKFREMNDLLDDITPPQRKPLTDKEILASNYPDGKENGPTIAAPDKEALAQLKEQEPVAWISHNAGLYHFKPDESLDPMPLYTTPPQRKPLTDKEILASNYPDGKENGPTIAAPDFELICFARQIEAAHGIKE